MITLCETNKNCVSLFPDQQPSWSHSL